jgi:hypothetical protein
MTDDDAFDTVATEIAEWQIAAQRLPLGELRSLLVTWQHDLAHRLDTFNSAYLAHSDGCEPSTDYTLAVGAVMQAATAVAIYTLGIAYRARLAAQQN